jgi:TP901 family phage tail tape measure protein
VTSLSLAFDILARDRASKELDNVGDSAEKSGGKLAGMGKLAGVAFAAIGGAAVAGAVKGITAFTDFQGQMNEVFTLLPGISQDAMDSMSGDVKNFSKEFGVLPDEVVPALYQSLSAGVPQDNVFEFLETAQQAAKGGVTELTTAVDGISSVVNAYGSDVMDATQASDLMFTAVKLGKTNFEELSSSLSNVTPIASGLGVQFGDVTAALATMTAKGTPTAQATTQLRSLFVELSKAGGEAATTFEEMAGKSFQDFIAEGGNTADALELMQKAADTSGVALQDMFGSVEAGSAALVLAGGDSFTNNIDSMGDAAGATETAFEQMEKGLGPIFDKIKANLAVFFIDVGEKLAPLVESALGAAADAFEKIQPVIEEIQGGIRAFIASFRIFDGDVTSSGFAGHMEKAGFVARQAFEFLSDVFRNKVIPAFKAVAGFVANTLLPGFLKLSRWVIQNRPVLIGLAAAAGTLLVAAFTAWATSAAAAAVATIAAAAPVIALMAAVAALVAGIVYAYQEWDVFRNAVDAVASFLVDTVWPIIQQGVDLFLDHVVPAIKGVIEWYWNFYSAVFDVIGKVLGKMIELALVVADKVGVVIGWFGNVITKIGEVASAVSTKVGEIAGFISGLATSIADTARSMWDPIGSAFKTVLNVLINAWNRLDFGIDIRVPGWVPGVGGKGFVVDDIFPDIPTLHQGGTVTPFGIRPLDPDEIFARLEMDETVLPAGFQLPGGRAGNQYHVTINAPGEALRRPSDITRELRSLDHLLHGTAS